MKPNLYIDKKEPYWIKEKFKNLSEQYPDLMVEVKSLETGDYMNDYFVIERKELDDFISSFTTISTRKTKENYERLKQQTKRMLEMPQPIKMFLVIGEDFKEAFSAVHEHSFNAQLAKLSALGLNVVMMSKSNDWIDYVYRLVRMARKYGLAHNQSTLVDYATIK